jgi:2-iminobutanoate/2-iminopropanoate deaminase
MTDYPASKSLEHGPIFSWQREHQGLIFTSGHAAVDIDKLTRQHGDVLYEARVALENLKRTLERAGSGLDKVIKVTVYLTDMAHYEDFNRLYAEFFAGDSPPARTCVAVSSLPFNFKIEIEAVAKA